MSQWSQLGMRLAGKWQIPLLALSLMMFGGALYRLAPRPSEFSVDQAVELLDTLVSGGLYDRVLEIGDQLLVAKEGDKSDSEMAPVYLRLARARYGVTGGEEGLTADVAERIVSEYRLAARHGVPLTAQDFVKIGHALEAQRKYTSAIEYYEKALARGIADGSDLHRRIIGLTIDQLDAPPERVNDMLDAFLAQLDEHRLDLRLWAIERKVDVYEELDNLSAASTLLVRNADHFRASDLWDRFKYNEARLLYKMGHYDEAETALRTIRNRLTRTNEVHAMTGWLLGRVVMYDSGPKRPQEALSFFQDVIEHHAHTPYAVASRIGLAEALAYLERHEEAAAAYRLAVDELTSLPDKRLVDLNVLRTSLGVMADVQRKAGHLDAALAYAELSTQLLDPGRIEQSSALLRQLGQIQAEWAAELALEADSLSDATEDNLKQRRALLTEQANALRAAAGGTYLKLAQLNPPNEQRAAAAGWRAAELYADAGKERRAIDLYDQYARERPTSPLVPRALLRKGGLLQETGKLTEAIESFQSCYRRFPRSLDGARALVPLADCYLALGPGNEELAEKTLRIVLEGSDVFTPQAPEFATALFRLGDVLTREGHWESAIATMEEALERYPDDPRVRRTRFLLADAYRRSGLALKEEMSEASFGGELERMQADIYARFEKARGLYRQLISAYEVTGLQQLDRLERMYYRHATLYEADCYFETRDFRRALELYEEAAGTFKDHPSSLAAYVQIINCHVFLGQPLEAQAALARVAILVDEMPKAVFDTSVSPETKSDWKRYFRWLGESGLF